MIRAVALLLALPALCAAQADPLVVAKPNVRVGDRWVYQFKNYLNNAPPYTYEVSVTFAQKNVIHTVNTSLGGARERDGVWTSEWNAVSTPGGGIFEPSREVLKFPLKVGSTWKSRYEYREPKQGEHRARHEWTVKVEGYEEIVVLAGKFRALKIVAEGHYQRLDLYTSGTIREVYWYVPRVKRYVKQTYEVLAQDIRRIAWNDEELVFYNVQ